MAGDDIVSDNSNMALKFGIAAGNSRLTGQEITLSASLPTLNLNFNGSSVAVTIAADGSITQTPVTAVCPCHFKQQPLVKAGLLPNLQAQPIF